MSAIKTTIINAIGDTYENMPCREVMRGSDAILSALDAAGYAVVPKEPTERMAMAFHEAQWRAAQDRTYLRRLEDFADRYKAMLTAAKETP